MKSWFSIQPQKPPEPVKEEEEEEDTEVLATRFVSFIEGNVVVLQYLPHKPMREYGPFKYKEGHPGKPLPVV